jgi:hypothetical protein
MSLVSIPLQLPGGDRTMRFDLDPERPDERMVAPSQSSTNGVSPTPSWPGHRSQHRLDAVGPVELYDMHASHSASRLR